MEAANKLLAPTPIQYLEMLPGGQEVFIKRDDLLGFSFGGNKCRIGAEFLEDMRRQGADFMVSYGSRRSNLNRVVASMCKSQGIPCLIISSEEDGEQDGFNAALVDFMGAGRVFCKKDSVAGTVGSTLQALRSQGHKPYYIYGDAHGMGNEETARSAYRKAYREIRLWQEHAQAEFEAIFLASGTGMTQGGLLAGKRQQHGREKIIGISVAREAGPGAAAVRRYAGEGEEEVCFEADYRCGGYGRYDGEIEGVIQRMMKRHGIALDPVYTGKAYAGMLRWLERYGEGMKKVLFIHTGGLPLYFDYLNGRMGVGR